MPKLRYFGLVIAATAVLGCGSMAADHLDENQEFTYRLPDQFPSLDPQLNEDSAGFSVIRDLFEGLTTQDENGDLTPGVATDWSSVDGNRTWIFNLRKDAKWSNGDSVTAHDFVYAWRRAVDPETASSYSWYLEVGQIKNAGEIIAGDMPPDQLGVSALGDYRLQVQLSAPVPFFPSMTTYATLMPVHQATIERFGDEWTRPSHMVSNGAYVLQDLVLAEYHSRIKNPLYWDADNVIIEKVTGIIVNDDNTALTRYLAGEFDHLDGLPAGQYPNLKDKYPDQTFSMPLLCTYYYVINQSESGNPALDDVRVRQALSYAIDRDVIVNQVLKGGQRGAYSFTHWATSGFDMPDIGYATLSQAERDAKAKELIVEAGFGSDGDALELRLIYNTSESHKAIANVISQMWKEKLAVRVTLENFEWKTFLDKASNQDFDIARSGWCGDYNEASTFLQLVTSDNDFNDGKFTNARIDELMAKSATSEIDPQKAYSEVELILADEMGLIPIYHYSQVFMKVPALKGWPLNNVENNWYSKNLYMAAP